MSNELTFEERILKNNAYYDQFALQVANRTENRDYTKAYESFLSQLPEHPDAILDIGCGTGHHLKYFAMLGLSVVGIEPCPTMRAFTSDTGLVVINGTFETISQIEIPKISGIWCAASLLHVPEEQLPSVLTNLSNLLPIDGPLYFSVRLGNGAKWDRFDNEEGPAARFMQLFSEETLISAINAANFKIVEKWIEESTWGRPSTWISMVLNKG